MSGRKQAQAMDLNKFMKSGIANIADTAARFYLNNRKGRAFMLKMGAHFRSSAKRRESYEKRGMHIPPFLIASIVSDCNLRCAGCYARANSCGGENSGGQMSVADWKRIFQEASDIGVSFILLAGGEPLLRRDVLEAAAAFETMLFPVFTNGTMLDEQYLQMFDVHRNLIPILSIEGDDAKTDERRGQNVSVKVNQAIERLHAKGILFGVSITVTKENMRGTTESNYVAQLHRRGCGVVFYIEYVPAEDNTDHLVLSETDLNILRQRIDALKKQRQNKGLLLFSFPGDEEKMGGCLAAGRGFFHINPNGGAEPCPFSPFSEINVKQQSLVSVLQSPFFERVRAISAAETLHYNKGGCTLFAHKEEVLNAVEC